MAENGATGSNGPAPVGDQTILDVVAENQNMIRGLLESLPTTIANATAVALRQPPYVPKQQLGGASINNR